MPSILFLASESATAGNDNHLRLPRAFAALGWETATHDHNEVRWDGQRVRVGAEDAERFDLIWPQGFGHRQSYYDRMQLLRQLDQRRFVNTVDSYTYLHGKLPPFPGRAAVRPVPARAGHKPVMWARDSQATGSNGMYPQDESPPTDESLVEHLPETHAAASAHYLLECLDDATPWVLKPSGASFGRDVRLIHADPTGRRAIRKLIERDGFAILQRYVAAVKRGEIRCLLAGGKIVGCYRRVPAANDFRANLATGGTAQHYIPSDPDRDLMGKIGRWLLGAGVGFASADIAWPYLIEINVANPGGLATLEHLSGTDPTPKAAELIAGMSR